jgi:hypothetical protein
VTNEIKRWPLSPKRPPTAEASRPPPGHRECNVGATLAHSAWSRRVVKVVAMAVSDERRVVQMIAERGRQILRAARGESRRAAMATRQVRRSSMSGTFVARRRAS